MDSYGGSNAAILVRITQYTGQPLKQLWLKMAIMLGLRNPMWEISLVLSQTMKTNKHLSFCLYSLLAAYLVQMDSPVLFSSSLWTLRSQSSCCIRRQEMQLLSEKGRKCNPLQCSRAIYSSKGNLILPTTPFTVWLGSNSPLLTTIFKGMLSNGM